MPSVDSDRSGSTVFVTQRDTNAQFELTLASRCLCNSMLSKQITVETSMRMETSLIFVSKPLFSVFCKIVEITQSSSY